ncbi:transcription factor of the MADS box [Spiromyces aspiralis]|uniref:Transcription factor of the MADS box n=1 Tax=Spiromyces aspiralis TaxID=68401 RepID=A0ACC1HBL2_9FUNG|nr:transcription factor of the MADS box [Spiromyces aspiralis]
MAPPYTTFATITNSAQSAAGNDGQASAPASSGSTRGGSGSGSSRGGSRGAKGSNSSSGSNQGASSNKRARGVSDDSDGDTDVDGGPKDIGATPSTSGDKRAGRRKIKIEYIEDKSRRHITFSKRKAGIMKKAFELSTLTGTQVLLLVVSETGLVYTFTTPKLQPLVTKPDGKNLIQACLNAPDAPESVPNPTADPNSYMNGGRPQNMIHYNPTEPQISPVDQAGAQMMSASPYGETQRRLSIQHGTPAAPAMNTAYFQHYYNPQTASAVAQAKHIYSNSNSTTPKIL